MARIGKIEFIDKVAEDAKISKKDATAAVESSIKVIEAAMKKGNDVVIPGFGSFKVVKVKARKGRNVQSGEEVKIPAHKKVKFTPGKQLTETVYKKK